MLTISNAANKETTFYRYKILANILTAIIQKAQLNKLLLVTQMEIKQ